MIFVLEREDVPADVAVAILEHAAVEPAEDVWRVVLRVGVADGVFQLGRESVSVLRVCREVRGCWTETPSK